VNKRFWGIVFSLTFFGNFLFAEINFVEVPLGIPGIYLGSLKWGDYDNDGKPDIAVAGYNADSGPICAIYRNNGDGTFSNINAGFAGVQDCDLDWGDYDNDGDLDVVVAGYTGSSGYQNVTKIYRNNDGNFEEINAQIQGVTDCSVKWVDFNNDGNLDIAVAGESDEGRESRFYKGDGTGGFSLDYSLLGMSKSAMDWGDFDNDGDMDILICGEIDGAGTYSSRIYENENFVSFSETEVSIISVKNGEVAWCDYDSDGDLDFAITGRYYSRIYRNDGGNFTNINAGLAEVDSSSLCWGDFDNDGKSDIVISGQNKSAQNVCYLYKNCGNDSFVVVSTIPTGVSYGKVAPADYDGDGDLDIALSGKSDSGYVTKIYKSLEADSGNINAVPLPPSSGFGIAAQAGLTHFYWNFGSDDETSPEGLGYVISIGTSIEDMSVVSGALSGEDFGNYPHGFLSTAPQPGMLLNCTFQKDATYYWRVASIDSGLEKSSWSEVQYINTFVYAPNEFSGVVLSSSRIKWTWNDLMNNEDGYRLKDVSGNIIVSLPADTTYYISESLLPNTSCFLSIEVYNCYGSSSTNIIEKFSLAAPPIPFISTATAKKVSLYWQTNNNTSGTRYGIQYSTDNFQNNVVIVYDFTDNLVFSTCSVSGLVPETTYWWMVCAYNGEGTATEFVRTNPEFIETTSLCQPPAYFYGVALSSSNIQWIWSEVPSADGYVLKSESGTLLGTFLSNVLTWTQSGLNSNAIYRNFIASYNNDGIGEFISAAVYTLSSAVDNVQIKKAEKYSVVLEWESPDSQSFCVEYVYEGGVMNSEDISFSSCLLTGLKAGTTYFFKVKAYNGDGIKNNDFFAEIQGKTADVGHLITPVGGSETSDSTFGEISIEIPSGAVEENVYIEISTSVSSPALQTANAKDDLNPCTKRVDETIVDFSIFDLFGNRVSNFNSNITIKIPYSDSDNDGLVDGLVPAVLEENLKLFSLNETESIWQEVTDFSIDTSLNNVLANVSHFSVFALFGEVAKTDLGDLKVYPNPYRPDSGTLFDSSEGIYFDNLPSDVSITVYTLSMKKVISFYKSSSDGIKKSWDAKNEYGREVASGIYIYEVKDLSNGDVNRGKICIVR